MARCCTMDYTSNSCSVTAPCWQSNTATSTVHSLPLVIQCRSWKVEKGSTFDKWLAGLISLVWSLLSAHKFINKDVEMIHFPVTLVLTSWTATGCAYLSTFSTSCAYWSTSAYMGLRRATCRTPSARSRVRNHGVACAPRRRPTSSCRRCDVQQWATAPSQDRALGSWNSLPDAICRSPATFKRFSKTYFYVQCFINFVFIIFSPCVVDTVK